MRELQEQGVVEVVFCRTKDNLADGNTKNVSAEILREHSKKLVSDRSEIDG